MIKMVSNSLPAEQVKSFLPASEEIRAGNDSYVTYNIVCSSRKCHRIGIGFCLYSVSLVSGRSVVFKVLKC